MKLLQRLGQYSAIDAWQQSHIVAETTEWYMAKY